MSHGRRFSVLVPCHDPCPAMLARALASVRAQLSAAAQVLVIDDASADPAPIARLAREHGARAYRTSRERGGIATHNLAFRLAMNELVHVLHPDDWVLPGFYGAVAAAADRHPECALYATRCLIYSADGTTPLRTSPAEWFDRRGDFLPLHEGNPLYVPACVVRRAFLRASGGWHPALTSVADWELWVRATTLAGGAAIHRPLAAWREHPAGHSTRSARTADDLRNFLVLADVVRGYAPRLVDDGELRDHVRRAAAARALAFLAAGEGVAARANERLALEMSGAASAS